MLASLIKFFLSNYPLTFFLCGIICSIVSIYRHRKLSDKAFITEALLSYYCLFSVGIFFTYNFIMHVFFGRMSASFIGWADSPFQLEVGFASLGFGVVGLMAFRNNFSFRLASILGPAFFQFGAAGGHTYQMIAHHNFSPGNAGIIYWTDWFLPLIGFVFLFLARKNKLDNSELVLERRVQ
jgi:hypothetical protein